MRGIVKKTQETHKKQKQNKHTRIKNPKQTNKETNKSISQQKQSIFKKNVLQFESEIEYKFPKK